MIKINYPNNIFEFILFACVFTFWFIVLLAFIITFFGKVVEYLKKIKSNQLQILIDTYNLFVDIIIKIIVYGLFLIISSLIIILIADEIFTSDLKLKLSPTFFILAITSATVIFIKNRKDIIQEFSKNKLLVLQHLLPLIVSMVGYILGVETSASELILISIGLIVYTILTELKILNFFNFLHDFLKNILLIKQK